MHLLVITSFKHIYQMSLVMIQLVCQYMQTKHAQSANLQMACAVQFEFNMVIFYVMGN